MQFQVFNDGRFVYEYVFFFLFTCMSSCFSLSPELMASLIVLTSFKMAWASCCL